MRAIGEIVTTIYGDTGTILGVEPGEQDPYSVRVNHEGREVLMWLCDDDFTK